MYYDEDVVLDIRLNTLNNLVDFFVICEATRDHAGNKKNLNFRIENFLKFKKKIHYLIVDDIPENVGEFKKNWEQAHLRDQFQRNSLAKGYKDFDNEAVLERFKIQLERCKLKIGVLLIQKYQIGKMI